jgi:hypothetical protein
MCHKAIIRFNCNRSVLCLTFFMLKRGGNWF